MRTRPTIYDVAKAAGVSTASVSAVLNGRDEVSPETALMIRNVMSQLGYQRRPYTRRNRPSAAERRAAGRRGQILFLVSDPDPASARTYQMQRVARGAAEFFGEFNLEMLVANLPADGKVPLCLREKQVKGVVLRGGNPLSADVEEALSKIPCVEFFGTEVNPRWDGVVVDEQAVGQMAFQYLQDAGCTELAVLSPNRRNESLHLRTQTFLFNAYRAEVPVVALEVEEDEPLHGVLPRRPRGGHKLGLFIPGYSQVNSPPEVNAWLEQAGLTEDRGVAVVSLATGREPHATLTVTLERIGRHCAEQIVWRMEHPRADARRIMVTPELLPAEAHALHRKEISR